MNLTVKLDPTYNEPLPRRYARIHCFSCTTDVPSKSRARARHMGHDIAYLDEKGERMD